MGSRKRVGIMMPASDGTAEPDFQRVLAPLGVTVHSHRLWDAEDVDEEARFTRMNSEIESASRYLARVGVDAVAYCCTTGSFFRGQEWAQKMLDTMEKASGAPAFATSPSVVKALRHFGAKRISVVTPYPEWNNQRLKPYMETMGFEVLHVDGHPEPASGAVSIHDHDPEEIVEFGARLCRPEADVLLCSCTDWRSLEVVERLEELTGKPVVTSNQATIWDVCQKLGIRAPVQGCGSLFQSLAGA